MRLCPVHLVQVQEGQYRLVHTHPVHALEDKSITRDQIAAHVLVVNHGTARHAAHYALQDQQAHMRLAVHVQHQRHIIQEATLADVQHREHGTDLAVSVQPDKVGMGQHVKSCAQQEQQEHITHHVHV
jgi:hypothetical protein